MSERDRTYGDCALLVGATLVVRLLTTLFMERPGYMDASYYLDGALNLYRGGGFSDPFIWNYLDDPAGIPHPSHLYWMPFSSILAYLSFLVFGPTYRAAQVPFVLLSSLLPILSYLVAYDVAQSRRHALCAGLFTTFSAFYTAYWVTPDNFAPFAVAGALCLWSAGRGLRSGRAIWYCVSGLGAGLAHLSRADGLLLVGVVLLGGLLVVTGRKSSTADHRSQAASRRPRMVRVVARLLPFALPCSLFAFCYLMVMGPWFVRNVRVTGSPLSTYGMQTVWLTSYDDLFSYGRPLTGQTYLAWGWGNILKSKLQASWINAGTVLLAGWTIFLSPFGLVGAWRLRRRDEFCLAWAYGAALYLTMSLVFTFAGWRGGMLHSTVALLPFLYAAATEGLDASIHWASRLRRTWQPRQAQAVFSIAFVGFAIALSVVLYVRGLEKYRGEHPYSEVAKWMGERVALAERVMVNDPATFYYHSRRECLSIPNADPDTVLQVMERYGVEYLLLDQNNATLRALYGSPRSDERFALVREFPQADLAGEARVSYLFARVRSPEE